MNKKLLSTVGIELSGGKGVFPVFDVKLSKYLCDKSDFPQSTKYRWGKWDELDGLDKVKLWVINAITISRMKEPGGFGIQFHYEESSIDNQVNDLEYVRKVIGKSLAVEVNQNNWDEFCNCQTDVRMKIFDKMGGNFRKGAQVA